MLGKTNATTGGSGGGAAVGGEIEVINKTGSNITAGDKVWINENAQTAGSSVQLGSGNNYANDTLGVIDRTGIFGYFHGNFYNITDSSVSQAFSSPFSIGFGRIMYMADNSMFADYSNAVRIDGVAQWQTNQKCIGEDFFINTSSNRVYQYDMSNGSIIKTYVPDASFNGGGNSVAKVGDYLYKLYGSNDSSQRGKFLIDYDNLTLTKSSYSFNNPPYSYEIINLGVTLDNQYIIGCNSTTASSGNGVYLYIIKVLESGNLKGLLQTEMPLDMQKWFSVLCNINFNPYTGILCVYEVGGNDYGFYKYENGDWSKLSIDLNIHETQRLLGSLTISDDITRICVNLNYPQATNTLYKESYVLKMDSTNGYAAVPYRFYNINQDTITGIAKNDVEANGEIEVSVASV